MPNLTIVFSRFSRLNILYFPVLPDFTISRFHDFTSLTILAFSRINQYTIITLYKDLESKKFKNIRSTILLKYVVNQIKSKGYLINNIDINIITQAPKISKYKKKMISMISKLCKIKKDQINIKGKTAEKLGVIGKEKAIACEVISSVFKYE